MQKVRRNKHVKRAKSVGAKLMDKAQPLIPWAVGGGVLYSLYNTHLNELKAAGAKNADGTPVTTIYDAVKYDVTNWTTIGGGVSGAGTRIGEHWKEILLPIVGGLIVREGSTRTKYSKIGNVAGWSSVGVGAAFFLKALLDPPVNQQVRTEYLPMPVTSAYSQPVQTDSRVRGGDSTYIAPSSNMPMNQTNFVQNPF